MKHLATLPKIHLMGKMSLTSQTIVKLSSLSETGYKKIFRRIFLQE